MSLYEQVDSMLKGGAGSAGKFATNVLHPTGGPTTSVLRAATAYDKLLQMESQRSVLCSTQAGSCRECAEC